MEVNISQNALCLVYVTCMKVFVLLPVLHPTDTKVSSKTFFVFLCYIICTSFIIWDIDDTHSSYCLFDLLQSKQLFSPHVSRFFNDLHR